MPVDQVHEVREKRDPEDRDRVRDPAQVERRRSAAASRWSKGRSQPSTGISARPRPPRSSFGLGAQAADVVQRPIAATSRDADQDARIGAVEVDEAAARARGCAMTIARPPMRGTGPLCTRGRSPPVSIPPILGASHAVSGVSTSTMTAANDEAPRHRTVLDQGAQGVPQGHIQGVIAQADEGIEGRTPALAVALSSVSEVVSSASGVRRADRHARGSGRHRRPRLRGPAARDGVRRGGLPRDRRRPERASACARSRERRSYLVDVPAERYDQLDGRLHADDATTRRCASSTRSRSACPRRCRRRARPTSPTSSSAAESVAANLRPGQLVVLQSTTYPGTTEEIVLPILERAGGEVGEDFFLGYAPERVDPGNKRWHDPQHAEARRRRDARSACGAPSCSTARWWTTVDPVSRARWWPRRRSCTRTRSAR